MEIRQFEDKNLAHYSYAIVSKGEIALVDPARNPQWYYDFAKEKNSKIVAVIETHPHADFVSSHLEIHETTGATIYASKLLNAEYTHIPLDQGDVVKVGDIILKVLHTPGHSPDSISLVAVDEKENAVFTGDTLFIGDCGRPDLREKAGTITATRTELAKQMYHSLRDQLMALPDDVMVYPAHGAGSLCGKGLSQANSSTIGAEKLTNWCLQEMSEQEFVFALLEDQPFVPHYFPFDVELNKKGAPAFATAISKVEVDTFILSKNTAQVLDPNLLIIDTRPQEQFKKAHLKNAINLMNDTKFETWLGSIVKPKEKFYLLAGEKDVLRSLIERVAQIGYEDQLVGAFISPFGDTSTEVLDIARFRNKQEDYTILDVRNPSEVKSKTLFEHSLHIPLYELRERIGEIPLHKPIVVHCAGGYRSAAASSIIKTVLGTTPQVFDLSEAVKEFAEQKSVS